MVLLVYHPKPMLSSIEAHGLLVSAPSMVAGNPLRDDKDSHCTTNSGDVARQEARLAYSGTS